MMPPSSASNAPSGSCRHFELMVGHMHNAVCRRAPRASLVVFLLLSSIDLGAQSGAKNGEWRTYGGDLGSTRYAPLDQINAGNFSKLQVAWRFKTDILGARPDFNLQTTPLMINGVLYATAGSRRNAVAIDAATGELLWMYRIDEGRRGQAGPRPLSGRGVSYWTDGRGDERIYFVTLGYQLVALNAKTGIPISGFGQNGIVDLKQNADQVLDPITGEIGLNTGPLVARDVVIVGAAHRAGNAPRSKANAKGYVRGFDVRTGKRLWIFHTIPTPGEFGNDTWEKDSWSYTGNAGVWAPFSVDEALGLVYLPVELATGDYFGGHRPGNNLFTETLLAVELNTGKRVWHYQLVHHGIWDYDIPCAPILVDLTVNGRQVQAVAQPTKQGFVYVFDRKTGQPVWPIEERAVEQTTVPGEKTSATQPFPTRPPAFELQGVQEKDLIDFTPEIKAEAMKVASQFKLGPLFTPPIVRGTGGKVGMVFVPNGANWPGGSFDPETGILYVFSNTLTRLISLVNDTNRSDMDYVNGAGGGDTGGGLTVQGLPLVRPPWGRITALDLNKGEMVWQIAHGETLDSVKNHPMLKGVTIPRTGRIGPIGTLTTKSLVISGESGFTTTPNGRGAMLYAYDKATGKEAGTIFMPAPQTGSPMTYMLGGKQYLVLSISGAGFPAEIIAYRAAD
jgi:quinoprotein glucose dehydrogenase